MASSPSWRGRAAPASTGNLRRRVAIHGSMRTTPTATTSFRSAIRHCSDPISGRSGGILQRACDANVCPKVLHLDTESDLWQARSSLIVTDTSGTDIAMPDEVRVYTVSGVSHAPFRPLSKPVMQLPGNRLGYGAFMRALLVALFEWVEHGVAPPASRFPSRADGTLVTLAESRAKFPKLPQVTSRTS